MLDELILATPLDWKDTKRPAGAHADRTPCGPGSGRRGCHPQTTGHAKPRQPPRRVWWTRSGKPPLRRPRTFPRRRGRARLRLRGGTSAQLVGQRSGLWAVKGQP
jgi:hypothetical protein